MNVVGLGASATIDTSDLSGSLDFVNFTNFIRSTTLADILNMKTKTPCLGISGLEVHCRQVPSLRLSLV